VKEQEELLRNQVLEYEMKKTNGATDAESASNNWLWPLDRKVDVPREFPNPDMKLSMRLIAEENRSNIDTRDQSDDNDTQLRDGDQDEDLDEDMEDDVDDMEDDVEDDIEDDIEDELDAEIDEVQQEHIEPEHALLTNTKPAAPVACGLHLFAERLNSTQPVNEFSALGLHSELSAVLQRQFNITQPSEIQTLSVPVVLRGDDAIVAGQTGTGKTLAYLLPLMQRIRTLQSRADFKRRGQRTRVLVVVPNRELVTQILVWHVLISRRIAALLITCLCS